MKDSRLTLILRGQMIKWIDYQEVGVLYYTMDHFYPLILINKDQSLYLLVKQSINVQELLYFRQLLGEIGYGENIPTPLLCDNQGAMYLAITTKNHPNVKHIAIKYHFVRESVKDNKVNLLYVNTREQVADIMTKALGRTQFEKFRTMMGVDNYNLQ